MKRLLKSKKGMSLLEVLVAIAILGVLAIPIMTAFMNTQIYAKKVDRQTEINAITRTVKQNVLEGMLDGNVVMVDKDGIDVNGYDGNDLTSDTFKSFIDFLSQPANSNTSKTTPELSIFEGVGAHDVNSKYTYTIRYKHNDFYNSDYPNVHNVEITIFDKASSQAVNKIKVAVKI